MSSVARLVIGAVIVGTVAATPIAQTPPPPAQGRGGATAAQGPPAQDPAGRGAGRGRAGGGGGGSFGTDENAELIFEERWTRAPLTQPMTQANLGNQDLTLHLYGDVEGIRKTQHTTEDYTYTGETRNNWMITVSDPKFHYDLSLPGKVMLRTRNTGFRSTHIVIRTADGRYFVSEEGSGESLAWMNRDYILASMRWRNLAMVDAPTTLNPNRKVDPTRAVIVATSVGTPDLSKVDEIGFTDLMPGGFIPATTRVHTWAVYGKKVPR